ncbi:MAG: hypothetical protein AAB433_14140 [Nitrospirota bacterium]
MITPDEFQALLESPEVNLLACGRRKTQFRRNSSRNRLIEGCFLAGIMEGQSKRNA